MILASTIPLTPKTHPHSSSSRPPGSAQHKAWNIPLSARLGSLLDQRLLDRPIRRSARGLAIAMTWVSLALEGEACPLFGIRALCSSSRTTSDCSARTSGRGDSLRSERSGVGKCCWRARVAGLRARWRSGLEVEQAKVAWFSRSVQTPLGLQGRSRKSHSLVAQERCLRLLVVESLCRGLG
jgi:hypothetical protein